MKDETPRDATQDWLEATRTAREESMRLHARAEGAVGLPLLLGSDIVSGLLGLPDGVAPYVALTGAVLLLRSALIYAIIRKEH